jgi:hypothetical protein
MIGDTTSSFLIQHRDLLARTEELLFQSLGAQLLGKLM